MFSFERFVLDNGLKVLIHEDKSTPLAIVNILYNIGARDEESNRTGFAHLFEHLMFEGSVNAPNFDSPLQEAGGVSNAFTSNDITNYYEQLPAYNLETALWLESDRMLQLDISEEALDIQKSVVSEEFKEHYINQPYGDHWHLMCDMSYKTHPYRWPTIGKDLNHIEKAELEHVRAFWKRFYRPNNATMVIGGGVDTKKTLELVKKWFGDIPPGEKYNRSLPKEPTQTAARFLDHSGNVPVDALYKTYHMCARQSADYYASDLLSDILGSGESSRMHLKLTKERQIFSSINTFISGTIDEGLFIIEGKLNQGFSLEDGDKAIQEVLQEIAQNGVEEKELEKVKNRAEAYSTYSETSILNRTIDFAFYELLGDANDYNKEIEYIRAVNAQQVKKIASDIFKQENSNTLFYKSNQN